MFGPDVMRIALICLVAMAIGLVLIGAGMCWVFMALIL